MSQNFPRPADRPTEAMGFHTTHWTVVLTASAGEGTEMRQALGTLCETYWYPLYAFVRGTGASPHDNGYDHIDFLKR